MLSKSIRRQLLRFCNADLEPKAFEAWVCADDDVKAQIGPAAYLDLISADYRGPDVAAMRRVCEAILECHHPGNLKRYQVTSLLELMLESDSTLLVGLRRLVGLYHDGCELIPIEFVGFESETDAIPTPDTYHLWDPPSLARFLARGNPYLGQIKAAAQELLDELRRRYPDDL